MKPLINVLFSVFIVVILSLTAVAAEQPPSLENQQFYGLVSWDKTAQAPLKVVAKVGGQTFSSVIKTPPVCGDKTCSATYGYDSDTILRVQASSGATIQFFLDTVFVKSTSYKVWETTLFDLNVATFPLDNPNCVQDWKCDAWSSCNNGEQTRSCTDVNKCKTDQLMKTEEQQCGSAVKAETADLKCSYQWDCSSWSSCASSKQTRTCARIDTCDAAFAAGKVGTVIQLPKPTETQACITGATGSLPLKQLPSSTVPVLTTTKTTTATTGSSGGISVWVYVGIAIVLLALLGLWWMMRRRQREQFY